MGEFRQGKMLTCDRKPEVDLEQRLSERGDLEKVTVFLRWLITLISSL